MKVEITVRAVGSFFEYTLVIGKGTWFNGGWNTKADAEAAAKRHAAQILSEPGLIPA